MILNVGTNTLSHEGAAVRISPIQARFIEALALGKPVSHDRIITILWNQRDEPADAIGNVRIQAHLTQRKIRAASFPLKIINVRGKGYYLSEAVEIVREVEGPVIIPPACWLDFMAILQKSADQAAVERVLAGMVA